MLEFIKQFYIQAASVFKKLNAKQRLIVLTVSLFSVGVIIYLMAWTGERQWTVLVSNLQPADTESIMEYLDGEGIPYRTETENTAILVPQGSEFKLRIQIQSKGFITGGVVGYELFDKPNLGMTEFIQQVNYKRALEGTLSRTIMSMDMIDMARVSIVVPKPSLFVEDEVPATASVLLQLKAGQELNSEQINSIAKLVSSSVEGLKPAHVSITDTYGSELSKVINKDPLLAMRSDQLKTQRQHEIELKNRLDALLAEILGPNNAIVELSVDMDFSQTNTTTKLYGPDVPLVRSEQREEAAGAVKDTVGQGSSSETTITNYEVNESVSNTVKEFGDIERISVSVMVNGRYVENDAGERVYQDRSLQELDAIRESVISAVGIDESRGDNVSVVPFQFDKSIFEEQQKRLGEQRRNELILRIVKWILVVGAAFVFLFVLKSVFRSLDLLLPKPKPKPAIDIEAEAIEEEISAEAQRRAQMLEQVSRFTREKPSNVASLLTTWLLEERL